MEEIETRVKTLETEFESMKEEVQKVMLDIKATLMEADSPLRSQPSIGKQPAADSRQRGERNGNRR